MKPIPVFKGTPPKFWNIPVDAKLDAEAFDAAHDQRVSKSEFIRMAVEEKIKRLKK